MRPDDAATMSVRRREKIPPDHRQHTPWRQPGLAPAEERCHVSAPSFLDAVITCGLALVAKRVGLQPTVLLAAAVVVAATVAALFRRVPETGHLDPQPAVYWGDARLAFDPEPDAGPVLVTVHYTVTPQRQSAFLEAMDQLRRSRRRTGASRWAPLPRRGTTGPFRRDLQRPVLAGTPAPARRPPHRVGPTRRRGGAGLLRSAGVGRPPAATVS